MPQSRLFALGTLGSMMTVAGLTFALPSAPSVPQAPQPTQPIKPPAVINVPRTLDAGAPVRVPCEVTHSGADGNGMRTCTIFMQFDTATKQGGIVLKGVAGYGPTVTPEAVFRIGPTVPAAGPLPPTLYAVSYQAIIPSQSLPVSFVASNLPNQQSLPGTATVTLTSVAPNGAPSGTIQDYLIHGTIDATLPALPHTTASGTVTIHVTF